MRPIKFIIFSIVTLTSLVVPAIAKRLSTRINTDYGQGTGSKSSWLFSAPSATTVNGISVTTETVCPAPDGGVDQTTGRCSGSWVFIYQVPSGPNNSVLSFSGLKKFAFNAGANPTFGMLTCDTSQFSTMLCTNSTDPAVQNLNLSFEVEGGNLIITVPSFPSAADTLTFFIQENSVQPPVELLNVVSAPTLTIGGAILSPPAIVFGSQQIGTSSPSQTLTITNSVDFSTPVNFSATSTTANFSSSGACASIVPGSSCPFLVGFDPSTTGNLNGTFTVSDNSAFATEAAALNGSASTSGVTVSPANLVFGSQEFGSSSVPQIVTITNSASSNKALNITAITPDPDPLTGQPDFVDASDTCIGASIQPGGNCEANITFTPSISADSTTTISGSISSNIVIHDDSVDAIHTIVATGTANEANSITTSVPSLIFGNQPNGTTSASKSVTLSTAGTATINVVGTDVTGGFILQSDQCTTVGLIKAGLSCTESIEFDPSGVGQYTGYLTIATDAMGGTVLIPLSGTGSDFLSSPTQSSQNISQGQSSSYTLTLTPQEGYTGTIQFTCTGTPPESTCSAPSGVTLDGVHTSQAIFNINTTAPTVAMSLPGHVEPGTKAHSLLSMVGLYLLSLGMFTVCLPFKRRRTRWIPSLAIVSLTFCLSCGGGSSPPPPPPDPGTPPGSYTVTLTASASGGTPSHAVTVTLNVAKK
jgi:hypothetical protein